MTVTNMSLYRTLVELGVKQADAERAATFDTTATSDVAVAIAELKTDLTRAIGELKADLLKTIITTMIAMTAIFATIVALLRVVR